MRIKVGACCPMRTQISLDFWERFAGTPMQKFIGIGKLNWMVTAPMPRTHSCKPEEFYDLVESMSPGPYADIFARRERKGWSVWGNETTKFNCSVVEPLVF